MYFKTPIKIFKLKNIFNEKKIVKVHPGFSSARCVLPLKGLPPLRFQKIEISFILNDTLYTFLIYLTDSQKDLKFTYEFWAPKVAEPLKHLERRSIDTFSPYNLHTSPTFSQSSLRAF